jgi:hypothetical protein
VETIGTKLEQEMVLGIDARKYHTNEENSCLLARVLLRGYDMDQ